MSETPKTDSEEYYNEREEEDVVSSEFARKQEKQITQLAEQCVAFFEEIGELRERVKRGDAMLRGWREDEGQDAKRLEFLLSRTFDSTYDITREAIDKAMEGRNQ